MLSSFRRLAFLSIVALAGFGLTGCGPATSDAPVVEPESAEVEDLKKQYSGGESAPTDPGATADPAAGGEAPASP